MKAKKHLSFSSMRKILSERFRSVRDWRQSKKIDISIHDAMMSGMACMYFQDPSLLQFQKRMQEEQNCNNLKALFDVQEIPKETQMREIIDGVDSEYCRSIFKDLYSRMQRGKHLEQYQLIDKLYYFPIDGSQFYSSKEIGCSQCLIKERKKTASKVMVLDEAPDEAEKYDVFSGILIFIIRTPGGYEIGYCNKKSQSYSQMPLEIPKEELGSKITFLKTGAFITEKKVVGKIYKLVAAAEGLIESSTKTYSHQVLQGGIAHPDCSQVIPFMPEHIKNSDGVTKQDCEMNAAKRLVGKLRVDFPRLGLLLGGDALFSKQPIIEDVLDKKMHYLFAAKPSDHIYMMDWIGEYDDLDREDFIDNKGRQHCYEWINNVPLNGKEDTVMTNFLRCRITGKDKAGHKKILYKNSWVTDLEINKNNINTLIRAGRCRWKNENELFNVMKNHGYYMEHSYGHGKQHLAYNFYLLTLLAFFFHQIFELTDPIYQANRKKFGSKVSLWGALRNYIRIIIFDSWEALLDFALQPTGYRLLPIGASP